jgi:hypothetical protein
MKVMIEALQETRTIFGKIEIETIIKKLEGRKLKQTEKNYLSRAIRPKLKAAEKITNMKLLEKLQEPIKRNDKEIIYNLSHYKYPLITKITRTKIIPIEELIITILTKNQKARFIEAIPILFIKNKINPTKLLDLAAQHGIKNKIGYLLETADKIGKLPKSLKHLLQYIKKNKDKSITSLASGDKEFLQETSPKRIKSWNLLGRFFENDWKKLGRTYL